jgi:4-cresol dehydrogenase (hydroxylating)
MQIATQHTDVGDASTRGVSGLRPEKTVILGVKHPGSTGEVSRLLADASRSGTPVYAVSTGRNWGYGASSPVRDGCLLLDLSEMNTIGQFDAELGFVQVGAGVTQGQLADYLTSRGFMMDVTGAGPSTSVVGNTLERGFGHTALGFRMQHFVVSEFVLADGTVVMPNRGLVSPCIGRVGMGAGLHELLTQSNLGIVTAMYVPVMRQPEAMLSCLISIESTDRLPTYIDAVRTLKQENVLEGLPHLGNRSRVKGMFHGVGAAREKSLAADSDAWTAATGIYGSRGMVRAKAARVREVLGPIADVHFVSSRRAQAVRTAIAALRRYRVMPKGALLASLQRYEEGLKLLSLLEGHPSDVALRGCYVRNPEATWQAGRDPVQDGCGFRWVAPSLPLRGHDVKQFVDTTSSLFARRGHDFAVTLTAVTATLCQAIVSISYDTRNAEEWNGANALAAELREEFRRRGWPSYRLAIDEMAEMVEHTDPALNHVKQAIKAALDPKGILSPGRYSA